MIVITLTTCIIIGGIQSAISSPPIPTLIYQPTIPTADQKVVCIVFDDGWKNQLEAIPILQSYNYTATFGIITQYVGYSAYMNWQDINTIAQKGMDIASHSNTHQNLSAVDNTNLHSELANSQKTLRSKGYPADVFIYPYGEAADNQTVKEAVAKYYLTARNTEDSKCDITNTDRYSLNAYGIYNYTTMQDFASYLNCTKGSTITILFYHKIGNEKEDISITLETFQAQMQYLKTNGYTVTNISQLFLKEAPPS